MKIKLLQSSKLIIISLFLCSNLYAESCIGIDTVYSFKPGAGQNLGQDSAYYPTNIYGFPDSNASSDIPASAPEQLLSLGLEGEIIVGFKGFSIIDGEGADFIIFENAFINPLTQKVFAEPAAVSVSSDGINFYEFPFDSLSLEGCAGTQPTNGSQSPCEPAFCGGNAFDLAAIGLNNISYIRIRDLSSMILNNPQHPYYDAIISGFDLDAVVGLHYQANHVSSVFFAESAQKPYSINTSAEFISIILTNLHSTSVSATLFDIYGRELSNGHSSGTINLNTNSGNAVFLLKIEVENKIYFEKILITE
jgi:hypothetical protein